jgi:hypothetical protein
MLLQFSQDSTEAEQDRLRRDPRTKLLAKIVESKAEEWGGRAANNIIWAHAVLGHGTPTILQKVS